MTIYIYIFVVQSVDDNIYIYVVQVNKYIFPYTKTHQDILYI